MRASCCLTKIASTVSCRPFIQPWYDSIENPQKAQEQVLADLVQKYGCTEYGASHNALKVKLHC